jgi:hypothetical protein
MVGDNAPHGLPAHRLRTALATAGVGLAATTLVLTGSGSASADGVLSQWYPTNDRRLSDRR